MATHTVSPRISWIGTGNIGQGMTKNLVDKGDFSKPLILYNRTTKTAQEHAARIGSSKVVTSIEEAVTRADIIFTCLSTDDAVSKTIDTALKSDIKGKIFVDCSTIHPDTTAMLSKAVEAQGAYLVACPVFGATPMAWSAQLICVVAGPREATEKVLPFCEGVMGRANIDFSGDPASKATKLKVTGNTFILSMVQTLSEGHVLAEKSGLGTDALHKYIEIMFPGPFTAYSNRMLTGDYYNRDEPLFGVDLARKDAKHAKALAEDAGMSMKIVDLADGYLKDVQEHSGSKGDIAGIYGAKRKENGLKFEN